MKIKVRENGYKIIMVGKSGDKGELCRLSGDAGKWQSRRQDGGMCA